MMLFSHTAFGDELSKIAKEKEKAIYSAAITAHEAGHANVHNTIPGAMPLRTWSQVAGEAASGAFSGSALYASRKNRSKAGALMAASSALGSAPLLLDEGAATLQALKHQKKRMTPEEYRVARKKLIGGFGSYTVLPAVGAASGLLTAKVHPAAGFALQLANGIVTKRLGSAIGRRSMGIKDKKVTAREAKRIVEEIAPGTPVFFSKKPMGQGSVFVPPDSFTTATLTRGAAASLLKNKKDVKLVAAKGGIFLAPTTGKVVKKAPDDFRRL